MRNQRARTVWFLSSVFITLLVLLQSCNLPTAIQEQSSSPQIDSLRNLETASDSEPAITFQNGFPLSVRVDVPAQGANSVERARNFLNSYINLYAISNPDLALELLRVHGENGEYVVFYQTYKGIRIYGGELVVRLNGDRVIFTNGNLLHGEIAIDTIPVITAEQAEAAARSAAELPDAAVTGETKLMIYDASMFADFTPDPHLAWHVILNTGTIESYVDALSGEVLYAYTDRQSAYELQLETANGNQANGTDCYNLTTDNDYIGDESSIISEFITDPDTLAVWNFAQNAYNFYSLKGRDSYNGGGAELLMYVHVGIQNAQWIGDCLAFEFGNSWVGRDVLVHEFSHAVVDFTSMLEYSRASGALEESYADIMAVWETGDWFIGESLPAGLMNVRDMSQPADMTSFIAYGPGSCKGGPNGNDNCGVHSNSAINNYVAYLLANGGTYNGWTVNGIGMDKTGWIMLSSMYGIPSNAQFTSARNHAVTDAIQWAATGNVGFTKQDVCDVRNAYAAVGIGPGDKDCDEKEDDTDQDVDNDGIPNSFDNCLNISNIIQKDSDKDGAGDACDPDIDEDSVPNENDNCLLTSNPDQADGDGNGVGDGCQDSDNDKVIDISDNCPLNGNTGQKDTDADGQGDACDIDDDNDGVPDDTDNAVLVSNPDQADSDADQVGDVIDNCIDDANTDQADADKDGQGDACDPDADNDGHANPDDNCPLVFNPEQLDLNHDGTGTSCDEEEQASLKKQFEKLTIPLLAQPDYVFKIIIPGCEGGCPDDWGYDSFVLTVEVEGLAEGDQVFVTDDTGAIVGRSVIDGGFQEIQFHPLGGRDNFLTIVFGPEIESGKQVELKVTVLQGAPPPPPQPTPTSASSSPTYTLTKNAFCRKGADTSFEDVDAILAGETVNILNISPDNSWYYVFWERKNVKCWVAINAGQVNGSLQGVQVLIGPPTLTPPAVPIEPSPTPTGKP